jgi:hypothetical protein
LIVLMVSLLCKKQIAPLYIHPSLSRLLQKPGIDNPQPVNPGNHVVNSSDPNSILMGNTQKRRPKEKCS